LNHKEIGQHLGHFDAQRPQSSALTPLELANISPSKTIVPKALRAFCELAVIDPISQTCAIDLEMFNRLLHHDRVGCQETLGEAIDALDGRAAQQREAENTFGR
jgi:hypothetical protein